MAKTLRKTALELIQLLARISAADDNGYCKCVSCGIIKHYKEMDGGHYIPKGASSYWSLKLENVHPQCKGCNGFGMRHGTATQEYTKWMIDHYSRDFVDQMERDKKKVCKIYAADYREMIAGFRELIKYHEKRIG